LKIQNSKLSGFSLVELLVVVAIVAVMAVSTIVGFGYLEDILRAREITGLMSDVIKQEELKVLRGDFKNVTIHFLQDYMVIEETPREASFELTLDKTLCGTENEDYKIQFTQSGNLTKKDGDGAIIKIESATPPSKCIEFKDSEDIEWNYQLTDGNKFSNVIRFVHFNIQRESLGNPIFISEGAGSQIQIKAPYAKKDIYDDTGNLVGWTEITAKDENDSSQDTLIIR
jgi:prepilin-type N-terminal cleavage/methylation domain-containing protein